MRGRIKNAFVAGEKVRTRGAPIAGRNHVQVRSVDVHRVDLIAFVPVARRLKDQLLAVAGKIRFGVFTAEGQLLHVAQMLFLRQGEIGSLGCRGILTTEDTEKSKEEHTDNSQAASSSVSSVVNHFS